MTLPEKLQWLADAIVWHFPEWLQPMALDTLAEVQETLDEAQAKRVGSEDSVIQ